MSLGSGALISWSPRTRALFVVALGLSEGLALAVAFDTEPLRGLGGGFFLSAVTYISEVPRLVVAMLAGLILLGGSRLKRELDSALAPPPSRLQVAFVLAAHALTLATFTLLTARVLDRDATSPPSGGSLLVWLAAGAASVACLPFLAATALGLQRLARPLVPISALAFVVGVSAWAAGHLAQALSGPLQGWTLRAVYEVLALLRDDAMLDAPALIVGTSLFEVEVAPECSGYEGMGLMLVFLAVFLFVFRQQLRFPRVLVLLPAGAALAWVLNLARMVLLILVGGVSPEIAHGGFHSYAGTLLFSGAALTIGFIAPRVPFLGKQEPSLPMAELAASPNRTELRSSTPAYVAPLTLFLVAGLGTGLLLTGDVDWFYPVRLAVAGAALWYWRREYAGFWRRPSLAAVALGLVVAAVWLLLTPPSVDARQGILSSLASLSGPERFAWLLLRASGTVLVVPFIEEVAFRGYLMPRICDRDFGSVDLRRVPGLAIALSSVVFGVLHAELLLGTLAGVAYAYATKHRGVLMDAIVAHGVTNLALVAYAVATSRWDVWL